METSSRLITILPFLTNPQETDAILHCSIQLFDKTFVLGISIHHAKLAVQACWPSEWLDRIVDMK
jgi:hypothetical protein